MNIRFLPIIFLFQVSFVPVLAAAPEKSFWDSLEDNLQSIGYSLLGIAKEESKTLGAAASGTTGLMAKVLSFWKNHPIATKVIAGTALAIVFMRGQQYVWVKQRVLDEARVFCYGSQPGVADPIKLDNWLAYNPNEHLTSSKRIQLQAKCNELINNLAGSSYHKSLLHNINVYDDGAVVQSLMNNVGRNSLSAAAIGCPQYYSWLDTLSVWKNRFLATRQPGCTTGFLLSLLTGIFTPYDGEATQLYCRLMIIRDELQRNLPVANRVNRAQYYPPLY
jgi:hypothetical protein